MRNILVLLLIILSVTSCTKSKSQFDLDATKKELEAQIGGTWETEPTNPDIGSILHLSDLPSGVKAGFWAVIPFPYDKAGKDKIDLYMQNCSAPLFVLGYNDKCTVITYKERTHWISKKLIKILELKDDNIAEPSKD